jgi:oligopeptide transport system substrate-binding protein
MKKLFFVLVTAMCFVLACQRESSQTPEGPQSQPLRGGTYRAALPWEPRDLDPAFSTDIYSVTVIQQVFDGLVQLDRSLNVVPALAADWRVSSDGLIYTFTLRRNVKFHNGDPVTAEDFVYSFTRILDPAQRASARSYFEKISGAEAYARGKVKGIGGLKALDPYTLQVALKEPFAPFLSVLAMKSSKVICRREVERWGKDVGYHPVGTGPFRFESWSGNQIVLRANADYFEGPPYLDKVVFTIYPGAQNERIASDFHAGMLEETPVYGTITEELSAKQRYTLVRKPSLSLLFYGMNCRNEALKDPLVRQAIGYAINKPRIVREVYKDRFVLATTVLPPGMPGYTPENALYDYSPEKARELLAKAEHKHPGRRLALTLLSASQSSVAQQELAMVAEDLAAVGIDLQVQYEPDWPTFEARLSDERLQMYRYAWFADIPDPDNFLNILCGSGSRYNFMKYSNPQVDHLLSQALVETEVLKRANLYREAERIILADAPLFPLMYLTFESAFQPYVKGLEISSLGQPYIPLKKIWLDRH